MPAVRTGVRALMEATLLVKARMRNLRLHVSVVCEFFSLVFQIFCFVSTNFQTVYLPITGAANKHDMQQYRQNCILFGTDILYILLLLNRIRMVKTVTKDYALLIRAVLNCVL